jgi:hypothetical protein
MGIRKGVYAPPPEIQKPEIVTFYGKGGAGTQAYFAAEEAYVEAIKKWAKAHCGACKLAGEEIRFQVADGYARYIVVSTTPVVLIHVESGDAYSYQYVNRLTAGDIKEEVRRELAMNKLFSGKGKVEPFVPLSAL